MKRRIEHRLDRAGYHRIAESVYLARVGMAYLRGSMVESGERWFFFRYGIRAIAYAAFGTWTLEVTK